MSARPRAATPSLAADHRTPRKGAGESAVWRRQCQHFPQHQRPGPEHLAAVFLPGCRGAGRRRRGAASWRARGADRAGRERRRTDTRRGACAGTQALAPGERATPMETHWPAPARTCAPRTGLTAAWRSGPNGGQRRSLGAPPSGALPFPRYRPRARRRPPSSRHTT